MKKLLLLLLISTVSVAQEIPQLKLTPNGVEPIVVEVENMSASEIYEKAQNWVQETYSNPEKVLKANITNEKIRIDGFATGAWSHKILGITNVYDMSYTVEFSFKDGKYRLDFIIRNFYTNNQKTLISLNSFFKRNGEIRRVHSDSVPSLEFTMNELSQSFYNYVTGNVNDEW